MPEIEPSAPPAPDGALAAELEVEQRYIDAVYERVDELRTEAAALAVEGHGRATLGKHIYSALFERDALVFQAARRAHELDAAHEGLIFGRLDLDTGDTRYIGRLGLRDADFEPIALDWRAPAAAPFYRATARDRHGVIRRRVIDCRRERVVGIDDDLLAPEKAPQGMRVIGDGALMAALSRARTGSMRDIVATIQAEQDEIIRASPDGATLITGGPGTGKTAVALHRAAYLLYADRRRFERGGVLIVGPSSAFMQYIERVLPSLGESTATLRSTGSLIDGLRADRFDEGRLAMIKGSLAMRAVLRRAAAIMPVGVPDRLRVVYRGSVLTLDAAALEAVRRSVLSHDRRLNVARNSAERALAGDLWRGYAANGFDTAAEESDFAAELADRGDLADFVTEWWPAVDAVMVLAGLADPERLARCAGRELRGEDIPALADSFKTLAAGGSPTVADVALIDELTPMLGRPAETRTADPRTDADADWEALAESDAAFGPATPTGGRLLFPEIDDEQYAHIVVDEAQDVSPMQWRALGRRGRRASWTVVGDPLQSSWADTGEAETAMSGALRRSERRGYRLDVNYRNPEEIFALAAQVIRIRQPDVALPRAVRSTGAEPVQVHTATDVLDRDVAAAVAVVSADVEGDVGVIVPASLYDAARRWLQPRRGGRVRVVEAVEAKGLEFDGVVVVEPAAIGSQVGMGDHLLYVALTRATQRLTVVSTDPAWLDRLAGVAMLAD
ncbi:MAG: HelD family protein [Mycobacteriales bacterium]